MVLENNSKPITIDRFISEQEALHSHATGIFTGLMRELVSALKKISSEVRRAGINDILGMTKTINVHGEQVRKIDEYSNSLIIDTMEKSGKLCCMISEEQENLIKIPEIYPKGKYILAFDPIDGSSNIDVNITIGTIFSLYKRGNNQNTGDPEIDEVLQPGTKQVAAGYALYGSSTIIVYTTGDGVHVLALDPETDEFFLIEKNLKMPLNGHLYSCNEGNFYKWNNNVQDYITYIKKPSPENPNPYNFRYVASIVADIHRALHYGGIYLYPVGTEYPNGKIRLFYEANPLAMIVEQAGGKAISTNGRILDIVPKSIHDRTDIYIGSKENVEEAERFLKKFKRH